MLKKRFLTALLLIPLTIWIIFAFTPLEFLLAITVLLGLAGWEWAKIIELQTRLRRVLFLICLLAFFYLVFFIPIAAFFLLVLGWWLVAFFLVMSYPKRQSLWAEKSLVKSSMGFFVLIPFGLSLQVLRSLPNGAIIILFSLILIWCADIGSYFAGRWWGKHKLIPPVSPGKTWEGVIGGVLLSLLVAIPGWWILKIPSAHRILFLWLVLVTVIMSIVGDLFESMMKRQSQLKDSGTLLPGHGGILDRIDSLTAGLPFFAIGWLVFFV